MSPTSGPRWQTRPDETRPLEQPSRRTSPRPWRAWIFGLLVVGLLGALPAAAQSTTAAYDASAHSYSVDPELFPVPEELVPNVDFWLRVYTGHDNDTVLLHDELHLQVVYAAINFSELMESELPETLKRKRRREELRKAESRVRTLLQNLAAGRESASHPEEQARIEELFATVPGDRSKYRAAMGRLRTQTCLRNRFAEGIERSGNYLQAIEDIFEERDLPRELTRLPFVESLFQWRARSSASAAGIWQFVPGTARSFLEMDLEVDERYDPLRATVAAARLLTENHRALESWPLAITAYNHGRYGMQRAVKRLGTRDLGVIARRYRSRTFGFASRNFYAEFVAAATAYENRATYFPDAVPDDPIRFDEFVPQRFVAIHSLADGAATDLESLQTLNPGMSREIWAGHVYWPKDYPMRVPEGQAAAFTTAYDNLTANDKTAHQVGLRYQVRPGDTLSTIAGHFGTSVRAVQRANNLSSPHRIRVGQRLLIPPARGGARSATPTAALVAPGGEHVVRRGETLSRIARLYGVSASALIRANGLGSPDHLAVGQRLKVPGGDSASASTRTHVVRSGDTLAAIARRYGTSVQAIQRANRLRGHLIRPSQVLVIP